VDSKTAVVVYDDERRLYPRIMATVWTKVTLQLGPAT